MSTNCIGPSRGFEEMKLARPTIDNHALCYDLLCLSTFAKGTIDHNKLQAALTFLIHGYHIVFYLTRLDHGGVYIMQEIQRLKFPKFPSSLKKLALFMGLKNMDFDLEAFSHYPTDGSFAALAFQLTANTNYICMKGSSRTDFNYCYVSVLGSLIRHPDCIVLFLFYYIHITF